MKNFEKLTYTGTIGTLGDHGFIINSNYDYAIRYFDYTNNLFNNLTEEEANNRDILHYYVYYSMSSKTIIWNNDSFGFRNNLLLAVYDLFKLGLIKELKPNYYDGNYTNLNDLIDEVT